MLYSSASEKIIWISGKLSVKLDLDGAYIPSFNNDYLHLSYSFKKTFIFTLSFILSVILFVAKKDNIKKDNKQSKKDSQIIVDTEDKIIFFSFFIN